MTIKLVEDYAVRSARNAVRDSLQAHGERCVVLSMYSPFYDGDKPKCPFCTDDVYTGSGQMCTVCWGTGFQGGVKQAALVWGLFTDTQMTERYQQKGVWAPDTREFQTEALPLLVEHDYVIRVRRWNDNGTPAEIEGYYGIMGVTQDSLRTGERFGQTKNDVVGQRAQISRVADTTNIAKYPVVGVPFQTPEIAAVVEKMSIAKTIPWPSAPMVDQRMTVTIGNGTSTFITIPHYLGTSEVLVQLYDIATGEQVDANIFAATISTVTLKFDRPPAFNSLRATVGAFGTRHAFTIGDGTSTQIVVRHNLGTTNVLVQLYEIATGEQVDTNIFTTDNNSITLSFQDAPATDSLRVVIVA